VFAVLIPLLAPHRDRLDFTVKRFDVDKCVDLVVGRQRCTAKEAWLAVSSQTMFGKLV
jgi:hypothetical protein